MKHYNEESISSTEVENIINEKQKQLDALKKVSMVNTKRPAKTKTKTVKKGK